MADILFVEDNPGTVRGIERGLRRRGHRVIMVGSGRGAIRELKSRRFDVIVVDLLLPEGEEDGIDLQEIYRNAYGQEPTGSSDMEGRMGLLVLYTMIKRAIRTPVILLSAYVTEGVHAQVEPMQEKGLVVSAVLEKPTSYKEILEAIESALAGGTASSM